MPRSPRSTALVEQHALVTLVGSGGVGKTRTSLQVAAEFLDGSGDGVWFVELAPVSSGDYVPSTRRTGARARELDPKATRRESRRRVEVETRAADLRQLRAPRRRGGARRRRDLARLPERQLLASSRQRWLRRRSDVPDAVAGRSARRERRLPRSGVALRSIALFVGRARAADQRFVLTDENAPIVADICRRLDGIALAIELAAARVKLLSPRQLARAARRALPRADRRQPRRAAAPTDPARADRLELRSSRRARARALPALGIFVNGFTLEGAVAVGGGDDLDEFESSTCWLAGRQVAGVAEPHGEATRYRLLESTRAYALEKLDEIERAGTLHRTPPVVLCGLVAPGRRCVRVPRGRRTVRVSPPGFGERPIRDRGVALRRQSAPRRGSSFRGVQFGFDPRYGNYRLVRSDAPAIAFVGNRSARAIVGRPGGRTREHGAQRAQR